jgi:hypothetical protein
MCHEIAIITSIFAVGNMLFGHFEEGTPKWRKLSKFFLMLGLTLLISGTLGRLWFYLFLGLMTVGVLVIHAWWLPKQGINGWTAEPREKYYALRGWELPQQACATQQETAKRL